MYEILLRLSNTDLYWKVKELIIEALDIVPDVVVYALSCAETESFLNSDILDRILPLYLEDLALPMNWEMERELEMNKNNMNRIENRHRIAKMKRLQSAVPKLLAFLCHADQYLFAKYLRKFFDLETIPFINQILNVSTIAYKSNKSIVEAASNNKVGKMPLATVECHPIRILFNYTNPHSFGKFNFPILLCMQFLTDNRLTYDELKYWIAHALTVCGEKFFKVFVKFLLQNFCYINCNNKENYSNHDSYNKHRRIGL